MCTTSFAIAFALAADLFQVWDTVQEFYDFVDESGQLQQKCVLIDCLHASAIVAR